MNDRHEAILRVCKALWASESELIGRDRGDFDAQPPMNQDSYWMRAEALMSQLPELNPKAKKWWQR